MVLRVEVEEAGDPQTAIVVRVLVDEEPVVGVVERRARMISPPSPGRLAREARISSTSGRRLSRSSYTGTITVTSKGSSSGDDVGASAKSAMRERYRAREWGQARHGPVSTGRLRSLARTASSSDIARA
jgi:hypothetical protein